jgi:hypothetical protein
MTICFEILLEVVWPPTTMKLITILSNVFRLCPLHIYDKNSFNEFKIKIVNNVDAMSWTSWCMAFMWLMLTRRRYLYGIHRIIDVDIFRKLLDVTILKNPFYLIIMYSEYCDVV